MQNVLFVRECPGCKTEPSPQPDFEPAVKIEGSTSVDSIPLEGWQVEVGSDVDHLSLHTAASDSN